MTALVCHLQCCRLFRAREHVLPFLQIAGNGGVTRPHTRALPLDQTEGLPSLR